MLQIFADKNLFHDILPVNELLQSLLQSPLTVTEALQLNLAEQNQIFQVPSKNKDFIGRQEIINHVSSQDLKAKTIIFVGRKGTGKTTLVIELCHILKCRYPDGVLWYVLEKGNETDVMKSMISSFGHTDSELTSKHVLSTQLRTICQQKNALIVFDNVKDMEQVKLLLPNSDKTTSFLITDDTDIEPDQDFERVEVGAFTNNEVIDFFKTKLKNSFDPKFISHYLKVSELVNGLLSAIQIVAEQIKQSNIFSFSDHKTTSESKFPHHYVISILFTILSLLCLGEGYLSLLPAKVFTYIYSCIPLYGVIIGINIARKKLILLFL